MGTRSADELGASTFALIAADSEFAHTIRLMREDLAGDKLEGVGHTRLRKAPPHQDPQFRTLSAVSILAFLMSALLVSLSS